MNGFGAGDQVADSRGYYYVATDREPPDAAGRCLLPLGELALDRVTALLELLPAWGTAEVEALVGTAADR